MQRSQDYWDGFMDGRMELQGNHGAPLGILLLIVLLFASFVLGLWLGW